MQRKEKCLDSALLGIGGTMIGIKLGKKHFLLFYSYNTVHLYSHILCDFLHRKMQLEETESSFSSSTSGLSPVLAVVALE